MTAIDAQAAAPTVLDPVRTFAELSTADIDYAGGKGANLGQLTAAGFPVPPGFVIGAPAYAAFRAQTGLSERLDALLSDLDVDDTAALRILGGKSEFGNPRQGNGGGAHGAGLEAYP